MEDWKFVWERGGKDKEGNKYRRHSDGAVRLYYKQQKKREKKKEKITRRAAKNCTRTRANVHIWIIQQGD